MSLNSNHVYLLKTESECYLWCGKSSTGDEREMAKGLSLTLVKEFSVLFEGLYLIYNIKHKCFMYREFDGLIKVLFKISYFF